MKHVCLAAVLMLVACDGRKPEVSGLGPYRFGTTTRADIKSGVCNPTELPDGRKGTWCFELPPIKVNKKIAEVHAYFLGTDPPLLPENPTKQMRDARKTELQKEPLVELQLQVRGCEETELEQWMRQHFGPAKEAHGNRMYWHNSFFWAVAVMPSDPGRCLVRMLPTSEGREIERIKASYGDAPASATGSGSAAGSSAGSATGSGS